VIRLNSDRLKWATVPGIDESSLIRDITSIDNGLIGVTTVDRTAVYRSDGRLIASSPDAGYRFARTRDGTIWIDRDNGINRLVLQGNRLSFEPQTTDSTVAYDLHYDPVRDILWATQGRAVLYRKDGNWKRITHEDGLLDLVCNSIDVAPNGDVWVGYSGAAYAVIYNPDLSHPLIRNYTRELNDVAANNGTLYIRADAGGRIWRGSNVLSVATPASAMAGDWIHLGPDDGVGYIPNSAGFIADPDGSVWFATEEGIVHFSPPQDFATNFPVPPLFVSGISIGTGAPILNGVTQNVTRGQPLTAYLGSLQFDRRSILHFSYRVLPEQPAWKSTSSSVLYLGALGWGKHVLQVRSQLGSGSWSDIVQEPLTVPWPVWLTWPVVTGYLAIASGSAFAWRRWIRGRKDRRKRAFPELAEWRLAALSPELQQLDGALLGERFEVGRVLARGGFAIVAEGHDLQQNGIQCAIKIFRQELADKEWMERRFQQELRALKEISHPNVVRTYGSGTLPTGGLFLVMEFIDGKTLREVLEEGRLAPCQIGSYLRQAGMALDAIHGHGIYHRDLKSENIMIRATAVHGQELVLIDFSIAIVKDPDETLHGLSRAAGTIYYMAPEQAIGYAVSATDIYSLAKVLIEMLTGERLSTLLPDASLDLPDRVRELLYRLPVGLSHGSIDLIARALAFDPGQRPTEAGHFAAVIADDIESRFAD
jgi:tRNA A-37 threonylcarbamoyl transferase component Bud32